MYEVKVYCYSMSVDCVPADTLLERSLCRATWREVSLRGQGTCCDWGERQEMRKQHFSLCCGGASKGDARPLVTLGACETVQLVL